jgi:hypothetical protein
MCRANALCVIGDLEHLACPYHLISKVPGLFQALATVYEPLKKVWSPRERILKRKIGYLRGEELKR